MSSIQMTGLISGMDTNAIIEKMMAVERRRLDSMTSQKQDYTDRLTGLRDVKTRIDNLRSKVQVLTLGNTLNAKLVTTSISGTMPPVISGTASSDAANGTFSVTVTQLASSTRVSSTRALGQPVNASALLKEAGFALTPTAGTFTINGTSITLDAATVLSDGVDTTGANTVIAKINSSAAGVTASLVNDAEGRANRLKLTSNSGGAITLGSGANTSNFLSAAKLLAAPVTNGTVTSTGSLGGTLTGELLDDARLATPLTFDGNGDGKFKVNGVEIVYHDTDTLNMVLSRINSSSAKVTATYDPVLDRVQLTAKDTGSVSIGLEDVSGNFLAAVLDRQNAGLNNVPQTLGQNALFTIEGVNNGEQISSSTNTVDVIPGVRLNLLSTSADPVKVTVSQNKGATMGAVRDFVAQFNSTITFIHEKTAYDADKKTSGLLSSDLSIRDLERQLRSFVNAKAVGDTGSVSSLVDLGLSGKRFEAASSMSFTLELDEDKLSKALDDNPASVQRVFNAFENSAVLDAAGSGSLASVKGAPALTHVAGAYRITTGADGTLKSVFTPTGGSPQKEVSGTIQANGANDTLIPGVTLTAGALADGLQTINVSVQAKGVAISFHDFLKDVTSSTGLFSSRSKAIDEQMNDMTDRMADMESRMADREQRLIQQFAAMEAAINRIKSQTGALSALGVVTQ